MAVQDFTISATKIKLRYQEDYITESVNEKSLALARGIYRGFIPRESATPDKSIWLDIDPLSLSMDEDSFAIYANRNVAATADGWGVSIRETTAVELDLTGTAFDPIPGGVTTLYVYILATYDIGTTTTATYNVSDEDPTVVISTNYNKDAVLVGAIPVTPAAITIPFDITNLTIRTGVFASRKTPEPSSVQNLASMGLGDELWGLFDSFSRWRTPTEDEKEAMTNASPAPTSSNPFLTLGGGSLVGPLIVDVTSYGGGTDYNAITGMAKGPVGIGVHGIGQNGSGNDNGGFGVKGSGGNGSGIGYGGYGVSGVGGTNALSNHNGVGIFGQGGGDTFGGIGVLGLGGSATYAPTPYGEGVIGVGQNRTSLDSASGVVGYGGTSTTGTGGSGGHFEGGDGSVAGYGIYSEGGSGGASAAGGVAAYFVGADAAVGSSRNGGNGIISTGGDGDGLGAGGFGIHATGGALSGCGVFGMGYGGVQTIASSLGYGVVGEGGSGSSSAGVRGVGRAPVSGSGGVAGYFTAGDGGSGTGGIGVRAYGGDGATNYDGGIGLNAYGGDGTGTGDAGIGVKGTGGAGTADSVGVFGQGGGSGFGGVGVLGLGGAATYALPSLGDGVIGVGTGRTGGDSSAGMRGFGGSSTTSGVGGDGAYFVGGDGAGGNEGGNGAVAVSGTGAGGGGYGVLAMGYGASDPALSQFDGAGLVAVGGVTDNGIGAVAVGSGTGVGLFCEAATGSALFINPSSKPSSGLASGCVSMSTSGDLQNYRGSEFRYVGCQAWANISTDGIGAITLEGNLGVTSATFNSTRIRVTFDDAFTSTTSYCAVATFSGSGRYIARVYAQATTYTDIELFDTSGNLRNPTSVASQVNVAVFGR